LSASGETLSLRFVVWGMAFVAAALPAHAAECEGPVSQVLQASAGPADARAVWLDRQHLRWPGADASARFRLLHAARGGVVARAGEAARGFDAALALTLHGDAMAERAKWVAAGPVLRVAPPDLPRLPQLHRGELVLVQEDDAGRVQQATAVQAALALDDLYAAAETAPAPLGATVARNGTAFRVWAPTAQRVALCLNAAPRALPMQRDARTGIWTLKLPRNLSGSTYTYLVDVHARGHGLVRNRVTDPYALSLTADSERTWIGSLDAPPLQPPGWAATPQPSRVKGTSNTELVIYELHVRDFSIGDATVPAADRGKYRGFVHAGSHGMRHLKALADAGMTDVHLLPVFDIASIPERGCTTPDAAAFASSGPASPEPQAAVMKTAADDCFNWGYDPWHYTAPEGSYASDAADPTRRIVEFRTMVLALHRLGLRVGMDVVYNHTPASGQAAKSVLDRIVPGYYHRLNAEGAVERSTCCDNTATEHKMMARLMIDSAVVWARDYRIDSFRFDLMGHQPRAAMERLQAAVNRATGRHIHLIGEGWNFGEIANGARFVQAAQRALNGSGIGSFSDRGRDAVRGGGCCDSGPAVLQRQGWANGLAYDRNPQAVAAGAGSDDELRAASDGVRLALAGTLVDFEFTTRSGQRRRGDAIDYAGQPAGFASQPGETVNYVENHDNPTLFDIHVLKLPPATPREERARAQVVALATTAFSQGAAYFHAGSELLRSKSLDRNSYDSGDWFNRIDWTLSDNYFGTGLPPQGENGAKWLLMAPLLAQAASIKPRPEDIRFTRDAVLDLLRIRASTPLFRLESADEVKRRLSFPAATTGPAADPALVVALLDGSGRADAGFAEVMVALNPKPQAVEATIGERSGRAFELHPVHRAALAAGKGDLRAAREAGWDAATGRLRVPARTAVVFVRR
jgi:pullulanase-type alpha-1,6-glucosidase